MIRNVIVHAANEQPLLTDLFDVPSASDVGLLCTNLRMMDGKRPVFIDRTDNTFFFPYHAIRFLEIPVGAIDRHVAEADDAATTPRDSTESLGAAEPENRLPAVVEPEAVEEPDLGEIDEDFLRRIRDI